MFGRAVSYGMSFGTKLTLISLLFVIGSGFISCATSSIAKGGAAVVENKVLRQSAKEERKKSKNHRKVAEGAQKLLNETRLELAENNADYERRKLQPDSMCSITCLE